MNKKSILIGSIILISLSLVYFISRIIGLNNFPIFTDEAIYLRWAQIAGNDASWRFISLTDGKQPLFMWLAMISMKIINDPIVAGRMVSVFSGFLTIVGLLLLGKLLFKKWVVGIISVFFYIIFPFALVYDRMALMDGLLGALMVWIVVFEVLLVKKIRLDIAMILGGIIGLAALTKTSGFFGIYLLPIFLLLFDWKQKSRTKKLVLWVCLIIISILISELMYAVLRLSPYFYIIAQKDQTFIYGFSDWIKHPLTFFLGNLKGLLDWTFVYLTPSFLILIILGLMNIKKYGKEKFVLMLWFMVPLIGLALFGKVIYARYIFFMIVPLLLIIARSTVDLIEQRKNILVKGILVLIVCLLTIPLGIDKDLIFNPSIAKIPLSDSTQYFNYWPSGWGVKESIQYFTKQAKNQKIAVYTEGTFGLMPASLEMYLKDNKNITIKGIWPVPSIVPDEVLKDIKIKPVYITFFQFEPPPSWNVVKIFEVKKGQSNRYFTVYQVFGKKE
jgi:4-amino-4-deoxy-L-arabinose transferase-like glycosyltransferase